LRQGKRKRAADFSAAACTAVLIGLLAPVSATEAFGAGAQRVARIAKSPGWRAVPVYARRYDRPFVLILGIGY
jgi:hypothetical protein